MGFDIERHAYGDQKYLAQLVLQDVLTVHGSQFRNASCIVASPPCQEFSYMAMPWKRGKQIAAALRGQGEFPEGYTGSRTIQQLTALFDACFRIQREACEAAGHYIPMVVENVKGAQPWVGKAKANFGSFYFWGDVAMVGGCVVAGAPQFGRVAKAARRGVKNGGNGTWFNISHGEMVPGNQAGAPQRGASGGSFQTAAVKVASGSGRRTDVGNGARFTSRDCGIENTNKQPVWFNDDKRQMSSKSSARKSASAQIAKIPFPLSSYVARAFKPRVLPEKP